jgi:large subunit ribosomal protein L30e
MSEVDISRALKSAITTGKVQFGLDQTMKAVKAGEAQMIILARNCPCQELKDANVKVRIYEGNNMELGALCGKPFSVSALAIIDKGSSNILTL